MGALKSSASALKDYSSNSITTPRPFVSNDSSVATVSPNGTISTNPSDRINLTVTQLAQAQKNQTAGMESTGTNLVGTTSMDITIDGKTSKFEFTFEAGTTNKEALDKIADTVNSASTGVSATVVEKDGKSELVLQSDKAGESSRFDASFSGSGESSLALNNTQVAQNAEYTVNGEKKTSERNEIQLNEGSLDVTLNGLGDASLTRKRQSQNTKDVVNAVKDFAEDFNKVQALLGKYSSKSDAIDNLEFAFGTVRFSADNLGDIGIKVDASGSLSVDENKLANALETSPDRVKQVLTGPNGLADEVYNRANKSIINSDNLYPMPDSLKESFRAPNYDRLFNFPCVLSCGLHIYTLI